MRTRTTSLATLTLAGLCATVATPAWAQQAPGAQAQPDASQPYQPQTPPGTEQAQPYPTQPYQAQPYPQPYQPQPYQTQPYQPPQAYPQQPQPYYPQQPMYNGAAQGTVRYVNQPRIGLIIGGAITLGASWLLSVGVSSIIATKDVGYYNSSYLDFGQSWALLIPVAGPWIQMGYTGHDSFAPLANAMLAFDGLVQAGGLAMLIAGAVTHTRVAVYAKNGLQVTPLLASSNSGILVSGRF